MITETSFFPRLILLRNQPLSPIELKGERPLKSIVRLNDTADHGSAVIESIPHTHLNGKPMAGKSNLVMCPLRKGPFPIVEGSSTYSVNGVPVALDGMKTACGASLIASGSRASVHR